MSLYRRGPIWWFKFKYRGGIIRESTAQTNVRKAEAVELRRHAEILDKGVGLARRHAPRLSVHIARYLEWAAGDHPATAATKDAKVLPTLLALVGDRPLDAIGAFDLERWRAARLKVVSKGRPLSRTTVNRELTIVRACFRKAVEWRHLAASPVATLPPWTVDERPIRVLTAEERTLVLTQLPPFHAILCRVTLEALLRLNEVLQLRRDDLGAESLQRRLKGGRVATVPVSRALIAELRTWLRTPQQVYVFGDPPPDANAVSSQLTRAFRAAGLRGLHHHVMRHTGVTDMLEDGVSPRAIMEYAGWTSQRMLERYGHLRDAELRRATTGTAARNTAALADAARRTETPEKGAQKGAHS
jgi:integrase